MVSSVADPVPPSVTNALVRSIKIVPSSAVPSIIDCVLATTDLSPSSLFNSLLNAFPDLLKEISNLFASSSGQVVSFIAALLYLLQKLGIKQMALHSFVCKAYVPVLKILSPSDSVLACQVAELLYDTVGAAGIWEVMMTTLVPHCLNSLNIHLSVESQNVLAWTLSEYSILMENGCQNCLVPNHNDVQSLSGYLPACYQLSLLLSAASSGHQMDGRCAGLKGANENNSREVICKQLLFILSNVTVVMLSQDSDMRACATRVLLPGIFKAYDSCTSVQFLLHGRKHINSRGDFSREVWKCCKLLLLSGHKERHDVYLIVSLHFDSFIPNEGCRVSSNSHNEEEFDIRADKEFWEEMRNGLVNKEAPVRKQALYILKLAVSTYSSSLHEIDVHNPDSLSKSKGAVKISNDGIAANHIMTRRERWAEEEAKSLGVQMASNVAEPCYTGQQRWAAFLLLYEMLEEYGAHLVEAAWNHQVDLLLSSFGPSKGCKNSVAQNTYQDQMETSRGFFLWLAVLWECGLFHGNPQVRCLIMQSFVNIKWEKRGDYARLVPKDFMLGPLMKGLNDPVHHKDFGLKGVYCSETIKGVANFFSNLSSYYSSWERQKFLCGFVTIVKKESFGRAGLMALATCIASFACGCASHNSEAEGFKRSCYEDGEEPVQDVDIGEKLLHILQLILEESRHHFNPNYRLKVCDQVLAAASTLLVATEVPFDLLLNFIWSVPQEFTDIDGPLRNKVCDWFHQSSLRSCVGISLLKKLYDFAENFIMDNSFCTFATFDDEDLIVWRSGAQRWARMLFLTLSKESQLEDIYSFIKKYGSMINEHNQSMAWNFTKFLLLVIILIPEYEIYKKKISDISAKVKSEKATGNNHTNIGDFHLYHTVCERFPEPFFHILEDLISLARSASAIFWSSNMLQGGPLPGSVTGKLGGPSQRRLATFSATMLLKAIVSVKAVAAVLKLCGQSEGIVVGSTIEFLWNYTWKVIALPPPDTEAGAEVHLATHETLADVLSALVATFSLTDVQLKLMDRKASIWELYRKRGLERFLNRFLDCINELLAVGRLARSRRAVLIHWKWCSLDLILCIPFCILHNGVELEDTFPYICHATLDRVFVDAVDSLENASEDSFLPMLRSIKSVLGLRYSKATTLWDLSHIDFESEMMWKLVQSAWVSHANCNKRRVAPIAALLSSILHPFVFGDPRMHETVDCSSGPLKWFVEKIISEGAKSPRTIRLAALHLTGLWFLFPWTIIYYMKELKLLTFYGSVAFDEDFEASVTENDDARREYLLLSRSPDPELLKSFINTEMYARVAVAILFHKLAELAGESEGKDKDAILHCGKTFLLLLLDSVVNEKDLAKELYKKYSSVHRRKIRAWQMICVLSQFIDASVLQQVISSLNICLYRNNLPAVRQYLETFAINIYLKFPSAIEEQLAPIFLDSNMRPQALSSYVFIAANVILHTPEGYSRLRCLNELLPPIVPFLTSHHHSLRGFTQILVYHVLNRLLPAYDTKISEDASLETKCFETLKAYLHENADCRRLRSSMQGFLGTFDPCLAAAPKGIFSSKDEDIEFECVPSALMDQVTDFLNDVREDLRVSIANDERILRNEGITVKEANEVAVSQIVDDETSSSGYPKDISLNFQKKVTINKVLGGPNSLAEMEEEGQLMCSMMLLSRNLESLKEGRQELVLVASLLDRIPNLAGLARTCEVFKAAALAVADKNIVQDKQFQLISVTAEKWVPIIEVPVCNIKAFLDKKKGDGFSLVGLEQTANSVPLDQYSFPRRTVLVLGREKEGIPVDIIHILDACVEIPQLGVVRSLNVHVSGAIAIWEYTRQQRLK